MKQTMRLTREFVQAYWPILILLAVTVVYNAAYSTWIAHDRRTGTEGKLADDRLCRIESVLGINHPKEADCE